MSIVNKMAAMEARLAEAYSLAKSATLPKKEAPQSFGISRQVIIA